MKTEILSQCGIFTSNSGSQEGVDTSKFSAILVIGVARSGGSAVKVLHSDNRIDWTDCVVGTDILEEREGTTTRAAYIGNKRYVKLNDGIDSPVIVGFNKIHQP